MFARSIVPLFFLLLVFLRSFTQQPPDTSGCIIFWNLNLKLEWKDFQFVDYDSVNFGLKAHSVLKIKYRDIGDGTFPDFEIEHYFDRCKSWTSDTSSVDLLKHEQLHFDINELFVRKIRKKIRDLKKVGITDSKIIIAEIHELIKKCYLTQQEYDNETAHGLITDSQQIWNRKISMELKRLNKYYYPISD